MVELPRDYITQYIFQYVGYPSEKSDGHINGGCPICREDSSWGKKARFYYIPENEGSKPTCFCHNCGYSSNSVGFIMEVTGMTFKEVMNESKDYDIIPKDIISQDFDNFERLLEPDEPLPKNAINLFNKKEVMYYKNNPVVIGALKYIKERRLHTAVNRPKTFYISLDDYIHKNRLIIPYYEDGKIVWYQTRQLLGDESPKYLSKKNTDRSLYNFDSISEDIPYIFVFEGAIDAMFMKNGTCLSGITESKRFILTERQKQQLAMFPTHKIVWVFDSPYKDKAAREKVSMMYRRGELVFGWPKKYGTVFKDINEMVMSMGKNEIPQEFILGNILKEEPEYMKMDLKNLHDQLNITFKV